MLEASEKRAYPITLVQPVLPVGKICFLMVLFFDILLFVVGQNSDYIFFLHYASLLLFLYTYVTYRPTLSYTTKRIKKLITIFIIVQLLIWLTGVFTVSEYFDYKKVWVSPSGGLAVLCSLFILAGVEPGFLLPWTPLFFKILKFLFIPVLLLTFREDESFARGFACIFLFLLIFYYLPKKYRPWILAIAVGSIVFGLSWRANVLRLIFCLGLILLPLLFKKRLYSFQKYLLFFLLLFPVILAIMSFEGLNIFYLISQMGDILPEGIADFKDDTRTFLYMEVINDLSANNNLWFGKGITGKYYSDFFEMVEGRMGVEVAFLSILLTSGIIGMIIYSSVILVAIYVGFFKSRNQLSKIFALFIAFHWLMVFIEVIPTFNQYYFLLWVIVGLCLSQKFRQMNDEHVTQLINRNISF